MSILHNFLRILSAFCLTSLLFIPTEQSVYDVEPELYLYDKTALMWAVDDKPIHIGTSHIGGIGIYSHIGRLGILDPTGPSVIKGLDLS